MNRLLLLLVIGMAATAAAAERLDVRRYSSRTALLGEGLRTASRSGFAQTGPAYTSKRYSRPQPLTNRRNAPEKDTVLQHSKKSVVHEKVLSSSFVVKE